MTISASDVKRLREITGVGMMDCKAALQEGRRLGERTGTRWDQPLYHAMLALPKLSLGEWDDAVAEAHEGMLLRFEDVTVTGVNDAPSFVKGPDVTVNEDSGPQAFNPWATSISAGSRISPCTSRQGREWSCP